MINKIQWVFVRAGSCQYWTYWLSTELTRNQTMTNPSQHHFFFLRKAGGFLNRERSTVSLCFSRSSEQKTGFGNCPPVLPWRWTLPNPTFCQSAGPEEGVTVHGHTAVQNHRQPSWRATTLRRMKHVGFAGQTPRLQLLATYSYSQFGADLTAGRTGPTLCCPLVWRGTFINLNW